MKLRSLPTALSAALVLIAAAWGTPAQAATKTHVFPLGGGAKKAAKAKVMDAIVAAVLEASRVPVVGETSLADSAFVLGCDVREAGCRANVAAGLEVDELLYGTLGSATAVSGPMLELTITKSDGVVIASDEVAIGEDLNVAVRELVHSVLGLGVTKDPVDVVEPPLDPVEPEPTPKAKRKLRVGAPALILLGAGVAVIGAGVGLGLSVAPIRDDFEAAVAALPSAPGESDIGVLQEADRLRRKGETRDALASTAYYAGGALLICGATLLALNLAGIGVKKDEVAVASAPAVRVRLGFAGGLAGGTVEVKW